MQKRQKRKLVHYITRLWQHTLESEDRQMPSIENLILTLNLTRLLWVVPLAQILFRDKNILSST